MESSTPSPKQERIAEIDAKLPSPEERAKYVYDVLREHAPHLTDWDLVCFSANYLGWMSSAWTWMQESAKGIARLVYTAHYLMTEDTGVGSGVPNRRAAEENTAGRVRKTSGFDVSGGGFT